MSTRMLADSTGMSTRNMDQINELHPHIQDNDVQIRVAVYADNKRH